MENRVGARHGDPGPLPPPPADLSTRTLPILHLDRTWYRIHLCAYSALFFNPRPVGRFNAPAGEYGTMYVGNELASCFVETFGRLDTSAGTTVRTVSQAQLLAAC